MQCRFYFINNTYTDKKSYLGFKNIKIKAFEIKTFLYKIKKKNDIAVKVFNISWWKFGFLLEL